MRAQRSRHGHRHRAMKRRSCFSTHRSAKTSRSARPGAALKTSTLTSAARAKARAVARGVACCGRLHGGVSGGTGASRRLPWAGHAAGGGARVGRGDGRAVVTVSGAGFAAASGGASSTIGTTSTWPGSRCVVGGTGRCAARSCGSRSGCTLEVGCGGGERREGGLRDEKVNSRSRAICGSTPRRRSVPQVYWSPAPARSRSTRRRRAAVDVAGGSGSILAHVEICLNLASPCLATVLQVLGCGYGRYVTHTTRPPPATRRRSPNSGCRCVRRAAAEPCPSAARAAGDDRRSPQTQNLAHARWLRALHMSGKR